MCIDAEGQLWIALWNGGGVARHDPRTGERTAFVEVQASHITCCCFGGESLDTLYISTAAGGNPNPELPDSGRVFAVKPGVLGTAPSIFGESEVAN